MSAKNSRRAGKRSADMSLPPEQRGRRRKQGSIGGTPPAQMSHASGPRAARQRKDGERRLAAEEHLHTGALFAGPAQEDDAMADRLLQGEVQ